MNMLNTLGIDWGMIIAQMINFGILLGVLTYLLYKPLLRIIDERQARINASMEHARKLEEEVAEMEKERKKRLKEADTNAKEFLLQARKQADAAKREILAQAKVEMNQILEKGRKQLDDERREMITQMQKTVTTVGIDLAGKILGREFADNDQKRVLKELEKDLSTLMQ